MVGSSYRIATLTVNPTLQQDLAQQRFFFRRTTLRQRVSLNWLTLMAWNLALFEALPRMNRHEGLLESQAMHKRRRAQLPKPSFRPQELMANNLKYDHHPDEITGVVQRY